jgi:hypothetical protein
MPETASLDLRRPNGRSKDGMAVEAKGECSRVWAEKQVLIALAGNIAEHHHGTDPGWQRWRSADQLKAIHESAHAVVAHVLQWTVFEVSIVPDPTVRVGKGEMFHSGGFTSWGSTPHAKATSSGGRSAGRCMSDREWAVALCGLLSGSISGDVSWRAVLRSARTLRGKTQRLVAVHWPLILKLAEQLEKRKQLDQAEISAILSSGYVN